MNAISIKQPWLHCITELGMWVESRSWGPPQWLIGHKIALYASKELASKEEISVASLIVDENLDAVEAGRGEIVATAIWLLEEVERTEPPVACQGYVGLWSIPEEVEAKIFPGGKGK